MPHSIEFYTRRDGFSVRKQQPLDNIVNSVRTVSDTKRDFYHAFPRPIHSVYRRVVEELLVEIHLLVVSQTFAYDPIFALGVVTAFDRFMAGYEPEADRGRIFDALMRALQLDPEQMRREAAALLEAVARQPDDAKQALIALQSAPGMEMLLGALQAVAGNAQFKYSRPFGIGLFTLLESADAQGMADKEKSKELVELTCKSLSLNVERLLKDLDLYRSNLEKAQQARQMMADLVEAERKKRAKSQAAPPAASPTEASEPLAEASSDPG